MRTTDEPDAVARRAAVDAILGDLGHAIGAVRCAGSQRLLRLGISMTHLHVLTLLRHHGPLPMSRVADLLDGSLSSVTGIVDRMEERGLVRRVRVPDDRRIVLVQPTTEGLDLVDEVEIVRSDLARAVLERLDGPALQRLGLAIADIRAAMSEELRSAPERYEALAGHAHDEPHRTDARG